MKEKGFTLIELLAVIVILAIIALIATPIVLNIIEDSKKSSFKQTGNGIVDAAEYYYMKEMSDGAKPTENKVFTFDGSLTGIQGLEFDGEIPKEGTITVDVNGNIELVAHNNQYCITKGYTDNEVSIKQYDGTCEIPMCTLVSDSDNDGKVTAGDKYQCKVKDNMEENWENGYDFYVLTTPTKEAETVNLIMDQNINSDGTPAGMIGVAKNGENVYNLVAWNSIVYNTSGPTIAMQFLYNATKDWTNIEPVNYVYNDKEFLGTTSENSSYISFISSNGIATITPLIGDGVIIGSETSPLRARMPIYAYKNSTEHGEVALKTRLNAYLYDNLDKNVSGYWTLSSNAVNSNNAWGVYYVGYIGHIEVNSDSSYGVRPVIEVLKSKLT